MNILKFISRHKPQKLQVARLRNNDEIPKSRVKTAQTLGATIADVVRNREAIIESNPSIDRDFAMPGANWGDPTTNDHLKSFQLLESLEWDEMRALRIRSQNFTGNNLIIMAPGAGTSGADPIPEGFEENWSDKTRDQAINHWTALTKGLPSDRILNAPNILGEIGWWHDGRIVNVDMIDYQERMSLLSLSGVIDRLEGRSPRILEIGGGYGALCLGLMSTLNPCQYVICDLPESLLFSGLYLTMAQGSPVRLATGSDDLSPESRGEICLLPNYLAEVFMPGQEFDLVINTLSMSEMTPHQVKTYGTLISRAIGSSGLFFEQNHNNKHLGLIDCREYLAPFFRDQRVIEPNIPTTRGAAIIWAN